MWYERFNRLAGDLYPGRYSREYVCDLVEMWQEILALAGRKAVDRHPGAELLIHPECACSGLIASGIPPFRDAHFLSSEQMIRHAAASQAREFIVATEKGMVYRLRRECQGKEFYPVSDAPVCEYMKMNTLEKLRDSLRRGQFEVEVDREVRDRAREAVERMLAIH